MPYLPGLDGMRALAVVAVMIWHANHSWLPGGFLGVEVFFVISGYLITLLLIAEHERAGGVSLRAFWGRRLRRLLPALYLTLIGITSYVALFLRDQLGRLRGDVIAAVFYVSNWFQIWSGQSYGEQTAFVPLRHLWSLAVEEQFYLLWPVVMIVLLRRGRERLPQIGIWLIAIAFVLAGAVSAMFYLGAYSSPQSEPAAYSRLFGRSVDTNNFLYLSTISRSGGLLLGAGFAMLWRPLAMMRGPMRSKGATLDVVALVALVLLAGQMMIFEIVGASSGAFYPPLFNGGLLLTGLLTVAIIAAVTHSGSSIGRFLGNPVLNWVGTRSYGLYLFHWPIYQIIRKEAGIALSLAQFVLAVALTAAVTEAGYRLVEMPVRRRQFFARLAAGGPPLLFGLGAAGLLVGYAGVSLASSEVRCTTRIECDAGRARAALDAANAAPATSEAPAQTASGAQTSSATTVPVLTPSSVAPARRVIPLLAIGESVMQGAAGTLAGQSAVVDADVNRGADKVLELVSAYVQNNDVRVIVIQVGTNGTVSQANYDAIARALAPVPKALFMTVKAPKDWIGPNNAIIRALPERYPNVQIIDWESEAENIAGELSKGDGGVHLNSATAVRFYANLILSAGGLPAVAEPSTTSATGSTG